eukprot:Pgem_evm1s87
MKATDSAANMDLLLKYNLPSSENEYVYFIPTWKYPATYKITGNRVTSELAIQFGRRYKLQIELTGQASGTVCDGIFPAGCTDNKLIYRAYKSNIPHEKNGNIYTPTYFAPTEILVTSFLHGKCAIQQTRGKCFLCKSPYALNNGSGYQRCCDKSQAGIGNCPKLVMTKTEICSVYRGTSKPHHYGVQYDCNLKQDDCTIADAGKNISNSNVVGNFSCAPLLTQNDCTRVNESKTLNDRNYPTNKVKCRKFKTIKDCTFAEAGSMISDNYNVAKTIQCPLAISQNDCDASKAGMTLNDPNYIGNSHKCLPLVTCTTADYGKQIDTNYQKIFCIHPNCQMSDVGKSIMVGGKAIPDPSDSDSEVLNF